MCKLKLVTHKLQIILHDCILSVKESIRQVTIGRRCIAQPIWRTAVMSVLSDVGDVFMILLIVRQQ